MIYGVIQSYDNKTKTANIVTVEPRPVLLEDVPIWSIFTGQSIFHVPLDPGTSGLILFCEIDSFDFLMNGKVALEFAHSAVDKYANAIFLPGYNSFLQDYDVPKDAIYFKRGDCVVSIKSDQIDISNDNNSKISVKSSGKIEISNSTASLLVEIVNVLEEIKGALTTPGVWEYVVPPSTTPVPCTANAVTVANLLLSIEPLIAKIDSFN